MSKLNYPSIHFYNSFLFPDNHQNRLTSFLFAVVANIFEEFSWVHSSFHSSNPKKKTPVPLIILDLLPLIILNSLQWSHWFEWWCPKLSMCSLPTICATVMLLFRSATMTSSCFCCFGEALRSGSFLCTWFLEMISTSYASSDLIMTRMTNILIMLNPFLQNNTKDFLNSLR